MTVADDQPPVERPGGRATESPWGRIASAVFGGALVVAGLRRRSLVGTATALVGGWLVYRGVGGGDSLPQALASRLGSGRGRPGGGEASPETDVERSITVGKPADDLYERWRDPDQLSQVLGHFAEVTATGEDRQRWTVRGPRGRNLSWEVQVVEERPGELLRWESPPDAELPNEGSVRFRPAPGDQGTEVTLSVRFDPPGGAFGDAALERLDVVPRTLVSKALRRFKSLAETGEIPTLDGNSSARGRGDIA